MRQILLLSFIVCTYYMGFGQNSSILPLTEVEIYNAYRINSDEHEFSPMYFQEGIVYVAAQTSSPIPKKKSQTPFFELYYASLSDDGMPSGQHPFSSPSSSLGNEGQASFSEQENLIYYTSNSDIKNENGQYSMKIYEARKEENDWLHIVELPINSETYSNRHPCISPDGQTLYFASNMPGGFGGSDLYMVKKEGSYWGIPQNLGAQINTAENDAFPFIYQDEYLFFSSKGHSKKEDYDIYAVNIQGGIPGPLIRLSEQFNSTSDDFGFILHSSGTKGFFSSNREGGFGKDDIYLFESPEGFLPLASAVSKEIIKEAPALAVVQQYQEKEVETEKIDTEAKNVVDTKSMLKKQERPVIIPIKKDNIAVPKKEAVTEVPSVPQKDKPISPSIATVNNQFPLPEPEEVLVEKSIQCAIIKGLLTTTEGIPLIDATITIRSSCGGLPYTITTTASGNFESCLPINCQYIIAGTKAGFQKNDLLLPVNSSSSISKTLTLTEIENTPSLPTTSISEPLYVGSVIEIPSLIYDLEHGHIKSTNNIILNQIRSLLEQHPSMSIEIIEHTDARGSAYYNYELSQARAFIVKNHLVQQGRIAPKRIKAIGMGEQQLKNDCNGAVPCSDEAHQQNKRTEIRIVALDNPIVASY